MKIDSIDSTVTLFSNAIGHTELYQQGLLQSDHTVGMAERIRVASGDDYVVAGMAVMFFILAIIVHRSHTSLSHRLQDFFSHRRHYSGERVIESTNEARDIFLLTSISSLSLSIIFIDDLADFYQLEDISLPPYWLYAIGYAVCMLVIHLKIPIYALVNWAFFDRESSRRWQSDYLLLTSCTAFLFYPIALLDIFYVQSQSVVSVSVILIAFLYEFLLFYKLLTNFRTKKHGYLPLFLYFCSVELMPALVLWTYGDWLNHHFIIQNLLY